MLNSTQIGILERSLDAATLRQRVISNNIANADTPHFKSKQVIFENILQQELNAPASTLAAYRTDRRHIEFGSRGSILMPQTVMNPDTTIQNNGNNVDIETEMSELAKNQIWYNGLVQFTGGYFSKLKSVIDGGGR